MDHKCTEPNISVDSYTFITSSRNLGRSPLVMLMSYKPGFGFGLSEKGGRGWAKENFVQERKHVDISHVDISHEMREPHWMRQ